MEQGVCYPVSNMANAACSRRRKSPIIHLIVQHGTTGGNFSPSPAGDQQRVPWSSRVEHPCNFILDNKLPELTAMWNPVLKPSPKVWLKLKPNKHLDGITDTVFRIYFPLSLQICCLSVSLSAFVFLCDQEKKIGYQLVFLTLFLISHSTSHGVSFSLPPFLYSSLLFLFLEEWLPLHSSCKFHDTFLDCFVVILSCGCFVCEMSDKSKHRIKVWAYNRFRTPYMRISHILHPFATLLN